MTARILFLGCALAAMPVWGETPQPETMPATSQPAAAAPAGSWIGVLTGTNVYVRSGPGEQAYPCTRLSAPDQVTVVGKTEGWLKILPPAGCFSVISKSYVQPDSSGKAGAVMGDNVWVRAGGDLRTADFWAVQRRLSKGEQIQILGEIGEYYKIAAPSDAYFYISERYVRSSDGAAPAEAAGAGKTAELAIIPETPTDTPTDKTVELTPAAAGSFEDAEKALKAEFAKPLDQRDLKALLARYEALANNDNLRRLAGSRVKFLNAQIAEMEDMDRMKGLAKTTGEKQKEYQERYDQLQKEAPPPIETIRTFAAKGVIARSDVFAGGEAIAKRYIVLDPQTKQVNAYVRSASGNINLDNYVGMEVGVFGNKHFDRSLLRYVVDVEEIVVFGVGEQMPGPPKPTIRIPKPVPQPKTVIPVEPTEGKPVLTTQPATEPAPTTMPSTGLPVAEKEKAPAADNSVNETEYH